MSRNNARNKSPHWMPSMSVSSLAMPIVSLLLTLISASGIAQTHCSEADGEFTHFSCKIVGSKKVASLCGGYAVPNYPATEYLQYRFGKIGKVEFAYPPSKENSLTKFEGTYFSKYSYVSYLFINDKALYEIELSENYGKNKPRISAVINVENDKLKTRLECKNPIDASYWDSLINLSPSTFKYTGDGKNSFLYMYHNRILK